MMALLPGAHSTVRPTRCTGLPWLLATVAGLRVSVDDASELEDMAYIMYGCVVTYLVVALVPSIPTWGGVGHAALGKRQGYVLLVAYAIAAGLYALKTATKWQWS